MGCVGFVTLLLAPFRLLASFCVLAGTGNSTSALRYCIAVSFLSFFLVFRQFRRSGLTFSRKLKVALIKFQYRVTRRRHLKQTKKKKTNRDLETLSHAKNRDSETPSYKKKNETTRHT